MPGAPLTSRPQLPHEAVRSIIIGLMLAIFLGALDQTIVAVSLPNISAQLHRFEIVAWVIAGYLVASTIITPIYGKLADLYGARALLSVAIGIFLLASVGCAVAQTIPQLIAARICQGLGGGGLISLAQTTIPQVVSLREHGRYQGCLSGVYAIASVAGPVVGGFLTHYLSWRWVFWINLPLGLAALIMSRRALAELPVIRRKPRIDYVGAVLLTSGLAALLIAVTRVGQGISWNALSNLSLFGTGVAIPAASVWHERRAREPILPLHLFKLHAMAPSCAILFLAFFDLVSLATLMPLRFEMIGGVSPDSAGLRLVPLTLGAYTAGTLMMHTGRYKRIQLTGAICAVRIARSRANGFRGRVVDLRILGRCGFCHRTAAPDRAGRGTERRSHAAYRHRHRFGFPSSARSTEPSALRCSGRCCWHCYANMRRASPQV